MSSTMREFTSPKRRDVFLRLRRRIDLYRQHHGECLSQFKPLSSEMHELQKQETLLLHRKWLENRLKKSNKHAKGRDSQTMEQKNCSNLGTSARTKRKHDDDKSKSQSSFSELVVPETKSSKDKEKTKECDIGFQDSTHLPVSAEKSQIMTNSNLSGVSNLFGKTDPPDKKDTSNNYSLCKQEPIASGNCITSTVSSQLSFPDLADVDELQAILEALTEDGEEIPIDLIKEMDNCTKDIPHSDIDCEVSLHICKTENTQCKVVTCSGSNCPVSSYDIQRNSVCRQDSAVLSSYLPINTINEKGKDAASATQTGIISETGPAAETLKQLAAQHQCHNVSNVTCVNNTAQQIYNNNVFNTCLTKDPSSAEYLNCNIENDFMVGTSSHQPYRYPDNLEENICIADDKRMSILCGLTKPLVHLENSQSVLPMKDCHPIAFQRQSHGKSLNMEVSSLPEMHIFNNHQNNDNGSDGGITRGILPDFQLTHQFPTLPYDDIRQARYIPDTGSIASTEQREANYTSKIIQSNQADPNVTLSLCNHPLYPRKKNTHINSQHIYGLSTTPIIPNMPMPQEATFPPRTSGSTKLGSLIQATCSSSNTNSAAQIVPMQQTHFTKNLMGVSGNSFATTKGEKLQCTSSFNSNFHGSWYANEVPQNMICNTSQSDVLSFDTIDFSGNLHDNPYDAYGSKSLNNRFCAKFQGKPCPASQLKLSPTQTYIAIPRDQTNGGISNSTLNSENASLNLL